MITINLYDYKTIVRDVNIQKQLTMVVAVGMVTFLLGCGIWMFQKMWIWKIEGELTEVESQVAAATPDYQAVQKLKKQQKKYTEIITGIDTLRANQAPTTQLLEDIGLAVPEGIWLTSIEQLEMDDVVKLKVPFLFIDYEDTKNKGKKKSPKKEEGPQDVFIKLSGKGKNDQPIVHLLEQLRTLDYIDAVVLHSSKREWLENVPIQQFEIYCHFVKTESKA
ncbi:MAG: hypothetical protein OEZ51_07700 [Nitrospinota bacterium]|nr:hypothetical protein [Nitrospinota bacterium]